jgi:hypothetical protein
VEAIAVNKTARHEWIANFFMFFFQGVIGGVELDAEIFGRWLNHVGNNIGRGLHDVTFSRQPGGDNGWFGEPVKQIRSSIRRMERQQRR